MSGNDTPNNLFLMMLLLLELLLGLKWEKDVLQGKVVDDIKLLW